MRQALIAALLALLSISAQATVYKVNGQVPEMFIGLAADTKPIQGLHPGARFMETDTNNVYTWIGADAPGQASYWVENYDAVTLGTRLAGERSITSTTGADYSSVSRECDPQAAIDLSTDASTTITGPTILCGYSLTVSVGTEAATIDDNTTAKVDLPVAWPVGNYPNMDLLFRTSLVVNPGTNSTGTLRIWTRPGDVTVTR